MEQRGENEDNDEVRNDEGEGENRTKTTFGFPILDTAQDINMKNIPPSSLPNFYWKINEDPDTFLFEFDILCRSYNYLQDANKLKKIPATLKDSALRWFMGLGESSIRTWEDMKTKFLQKILRVLQTKILSKRYIYNTSTRIQELGRLSQKIYLYIT